MKESQLNFTKPTLNSLPPPDKGKRAYYYDSKVRGLVVAITPAGTKTFLVYRKINGKPERITIGQYPNVSIEQARKKALDINAQIARGENPNDTKRLERTEITLEKLFSYYLDHHAKIHKKTWQDDEKQFNRYLTDWRNKRLSSITKQDIQKLHQKTGRENGIYAANRLLALLSTLFNKAIEFSLWEKANPVTAIKI